jgi:hypothetical protein
MFFNLYSFLIDKGKREREREKGERERDLILL